MTPSGLEVLRDPAGGVEVLVARGFGREAASAIVDLARQCQAAVGEVGSGRPATGVFVPGRVEVLGKHTDYAGGRSLISAVDRGFVATGSARSDGVVSLIDARTGERASFSLRHASVAAEGWANYPQTVVRRLSRNFPDARLGADIAFASNLPPASGMSSSSAFMISIFQVLAALNDLPSTSRYRERLGTPEQLAEYLASVENGSGFADLQGDRGVGTRGGSEDHTAILCGRPGALVQYSFAPVRFERAVAFPAEFVLIVASSGVRAEKSAGARDRYNRAAALAGEVVAAWNVATGRSDPHMAAVLESSPDPLGALRGILAAHGSAGDRRALLARLEQFRDESEEIIPAASDALAAGDLASFGALVDRSQQLAESLLGNQVEETIHLARGARRLGAAAASAFGAGFGGSVWAMVERRVAGELRDLWRSDYLERFPEHAESAEFFEVRPGPAALALA